jgi:glycosyltransferase involved in cell wall biosynthesis
LTDPHSSSISVSVVVPVRNAMRYLPRTLPSVVAAARRKGGVEIIYVDNGSDDGTPDYLARAEGCQVLRLEKASIAKSRNVGAQRAKGEYIAFLDADCAIEPDYFGRAIDAIRTSGAAATGFEVQLPPQTHWIPRVWKSLHEVGADKDVGWINSANFFTVRRIFEEVGGFREDLRTGEDAELGQRLNRAGYRLRADHRVSVTHYGNPESARDFYRRSVWHALGMFGTVNLEGVDKPTVMMFVHLAATIAGAVILVRGPGNWLARVTLALLLQFFAPAVTVLYRAWRGRRAVDFLRGGFVYWLYYWARLQALMIVAAGKTDEYRK